MSKRSKGLSVLAISLLLLAACGEKNTSTESPTEKEKVTETSAAASTSEETSTEEANADENSSSSEQNTATTDETSTSSNEETVDSEITEEKKTSDKTATVSAKKEETTINPTIKKFIKNQLTLGKKGQIEGIPFTSGESLFEDITTKWGEPTTQFSNDTNYIEYAKNGQVNYAFAVGRGDRIYDVRTFVSPSSSFKLADISFEDIQAVAGKPTTVTTSGTDKILNYTFGDNTIKFVGPNKTKKLHHISVFNLPSSKTMGGED